MRLYKVEVVWFPDEEKAKYIVSPIPKDKIYSPRTIKILKNKGYFSSAWSMYVIDAEYSYHEDKEIPDYDKELFNTVRDFIVKEKLKDFIDG